MKRWLIFFTALAAAHGATYFATTSGANINAANLWVPTSSGACTGTGTPLSSLSALTPNVDVLDTNGCASAIVINVDPCPSCGAGQAVKLTNATGGGSFSLNAATLGASTWHFGAAGGGTTGAATIAITGVSASGTIICGTFGSVGGTVANSTGMTASHTGTGISFTCNFTSGTAASTYGILNSGTATTVNITGNCTATSASGCHASFQGTTNITGTCTGADAAYNVGCNNAGTTLGAMTITGPIVNGLKGAGAQGYRFPSSPNGTDYFCVPLDSSYVAFTGSNAASAEDCTHTGGGAGNSSHAKKITYAASGGGAPTIYSGGWPR